MPGWLCVLSAKLTSLSFIQGLPTKTRTQSSIQPGMSQNIASNETEKKNKKTVNAK